MRFLSRMAVVCGVVVAGIGCGSDGDGDGDGNADGDADASSGGPGGGGAGAGPASGSGGASPGACDTCGAGEVCDFQYHQCTPTDRVCGTAFGSCAPPRTDCTPADLPVCGCDGNFYDNECAANAAGVDMGDDACGSDKAPLGRIPCGVYYCDPATTFCWVGHGDQCDIFYECRPLGEDCGAPPVADCDCVLPACPGSCQCTVVQGNGVHGVRVDETLI